MCDRTFCDLHLQQASIDAEPIEQVAMTVLPRLRGAFCLTFINETTLFAPPHPNATAFHTRNAR